MKLLAVLICGLTWIVCDCRGSSIEEAMVIDEVDDLFDTDLWEDIDDGESDDILSRQKRQAPPSSTQVVRYDITSVIIARFSETLITSEVLNLEFAPKTINFKTQIPNSAFISKFSIVVDGQEYVGKVMKKGDAVKAFEQAQARGESAGLVRQEKQRGALWFPVSIAIRPGGKVIFKLRYQELLVKSLNAYEKIILADPEQEITNFNVKIMITEPTGITNINTGKPFIGKTLTASRDDSFDLDERFSKTQAQITFTASNYMPKNPSSLKFVISYNVNQPVSGNTIWTHNGYFAHFISPQLTALPKHIVFAIDVSGSMRQSNKLEQTKDAVNAVLDDLGEDDIFNIVTFNAKATAWKDQMQSAYSIHTINTAKSFVKGLQASGGTNFYGGLLKSIKLLDNYNALSETGDTAGTSTIFILTDGQPSVGTTNRDEIIAGVQKENKKKYSIFTVGFGPSVEADFLNKLALKNQAIFKRVEVAQDAAVQLNNFYKEHATPMLTDLTASYFGNVADVTQKEVPVFFKGAELMVVGKVNPGSPPLRTTVTANGFSSPFTKSQTAVEFDTDFIYPVSDEVQVDFNNFFERMWAQLTIRQLAIQSAVVDAIELKAIRNRILQLSLQHQLVTSETAMVAVMPSGNNQRVELTENPIQIQAHFISPAPTTRPANTNRPTTTTRGSIGWSRRRRRFTTTTRPTRPPTTTRTPSTRPTLPATTTASFVAMPVPIHPNTINTRSSSERCGGNLEVGSSPLMVQSHGKMYHRNLVCKWVVTSSTNRPLQLRFTRLDLEYHPQCARDRVIIYKDDHTTSKPQKEVFCGFYFSYYRTITANQQFTIVFETDGAVQGAGFTTLISHA